MDGQVRKSQELRDKNQEIKYLTAIDDLRNSETNQRNQIINKNQRSGNIKK